MDFSLTPELESLRQQVDGVIDRQGLHLLTVEQLPRCVERLLAQT